MVIATASSTTARPPTAYPASCTRPVTRCQFAPAAQPAHARPAIHGTQPATVYRPNRTGDSLANPAGSEMNVLITGRSRPMKTERAPYLSNHRSALALPSSLPATNLVRLHQRV